MDTAHSLMRWFRSGFTALGSHPLPAEIEIQGARYVHRRLFKNDFFAATAMYEGDHDRIVLKVERQARFLGMPLAWLGRLLANRECAALERLRGVEGVPALRERWGRTGFLRTYIEGHPLARNERVPDEFHFRLGALIDAIHARGMAYVDLEKSENVLVGDDGRPYLFDFQIAWYWPKRWGGELWPMRKLRAWLQQGDRYHLMKLHRRTRPDQLSPEVIADSYHKPWHVRTYRALVRPLLWCRRRLLDGLRLRRVGGERGRVIATEGQSPLPPAPTVKEVTARASLPV